MITVVEGEQMGYKYGHGFAMSCTAKCRYQEWSSYWGKSIGDRGGGGGGGGR